MNIKGIIFDFGFTLFHFKDVSIEKYLDCYNRGLKRSLEHLQNIDIILNNDIAAKFTKYFNDRRNFFFKESRKTKNEYSTSYIFRDVFGLMIENGIIDSISENNKVQYRKLADLYHSCEEEEWIPFDHTKATLEQLMNKNIKMVVLSNHPNHSTIKNLLKKFDLDKFFDKIITSAKFGKRKPNPDIFKHALKIIGMEKNANECVMCGDEYADIFGGHQVGLQLFLCKRKYRFPFEKEIDISNLVTIQKISDLLEYV